MKKSRYSAVANASTIEQAIAAQGNTGYATDSSYSQKLATINRSNVGGSDPITADYSEKSMQIARTRFNTYTMPFWRVLVQPCIHGRT